MRYFLSCFTGIVMCMMASAQSSEFFEKKIYRSENGSLPYRFLKPATEKERKPLIIFLHGAGERGTDNEAQLKHIEDWLLNAKNREKYSCYVLAPQCPKGEWWARHAKDGSTLSSPTSTMKLVLELLNQIEKDFLIDTTRIYITGVSMGGYGTWDLLARYPGKFAAAIPVCGGGDVKKTPSFKDVPIWAFHGALDETVAPYNSRKMIHALQKAGGKPGYTEYPDVAHNSWVRAYQEPYLLSWLFKQKNEGNKHQIND